MDSGNVHIFSEGVFMESWEELLQQASAARQQKNWAELAGIAQELQKLHREEGDLFYCEALLAQNKFEEADRAGQVMLEHFPSSQACLRRYAEITLRGCDWPRTRERARMLREQFPADPFGWHAGCRALREMRRFEEAEQLCAVMLKKFPGNFACLWQAVWLAYQSRNFHSTLERAQKLQEKFPQRCEGGRFHAIALCELENYEAADAVSLQQIEKFPDNVTCHYRYVENAVHACNWPEVIVRAENMLKKYPDHIACMFDLATAYIKTNDCQSFENIAEEICQKTQNTPAANQNYARLASLDMENADSCFWGKKLASFTPAPNQRDTTLFFEWGPNGILATISLLQQLNEYLSAKNAHLYICFYPLLGSIVLKNDFEYSIANAFRVKHNKNKYQYDYFSSLFEDIPYADAEYLKEICNIPEIYTNASGGLAFRDHATKAVNTCNGKRVTCYQQATAENKVFICGSCVVYGYPSEDKHTIASLLQQRINNENLPLNVYNLGFPGGRLHKLINNLQQEDIRENDIVFLIPPYIPYNFPLLKAFCLYNKIPMQDFSHIFANRRSIYGKVFSDRATHLTYKGNQLFADTLFENFIKYYNSIKNSESKIAEFAKTYLNASQDVESPQEDETATAIHKMFSQYPRFEGKIGSIVMNCNPFTNGHLHLIRLASQLVNHLYIFVVEEDKSVFKFADRLRLVQQGCASLRNVTVMPSGKFILSAETFPEYFTKESKKDITVDPSGDIHIFGKYIAKEFNISIRFVGEEPLDKITRQYNESMRTVLPKYGIQFIEIPRKEEGEGVISASRVRRLMQEGNFEEIKNLVPPTTLEFLRKDFPGSKQTVEAAPHPASKTLFATLRRFLGKSR